MFSHFRHLWDWKSWTIIFFFCSFFSCFGFFHIIFCHIAKVSIFSQWVHLPKKRWSLLFLSMHRPFVNRNLIPLTYWTACHVHPNEWTVMASSDLLYITDEPSYSKGTAGWHECPEQCDERTCWSMSYSFVLFLTLYSSIFPFLLRHLFVSSVLLLLVGYLSPVSCFFFFFDCLFRLEIHLSSIVVFFFPQFAQGFFFSLHISFSFWTHSCIVGKV